MQDNFDLWGLLPEGRNPLVYQSRSVEKRKESRGKKKMRQYTNFEMFAITKEYINKHHSDNPMDFVTNVYIK